jgi:hypothetical protein
MKDEREGDICVEGRRGRKGGWGQVERQTSGGTGRYRDR